MKPLLALSLLVPAALAAQDAATARRTFEAGHYREVVDSTGANPSPDFLFTLAQSYQRLGHGDEARDTYRQIAERPETDPWHFVGRSGQQLLDDQLDEALESAERAVALDGALPEAHYQLGLVLARRREWARGATAFDRVTELDPERAYGYYYGGVMHYRANRPDRMANHFEQFLKLAPDAPERPEVLQIMKTVRGR
jgi:tetratricopeptide (TPR) repeat protein